MLRSKLTKAVVAFAALSLVASAAYASIPAGNGTISACKDAKGALKVIDAEAGQTCGPNQQPLSWNQQGPAGPQGPAGISGYSGSVEYSALNSSTKKLASAACPPGTRVLGGGGLITSELGTGTTGIAIVYSYAFAGSWYVGAEEIVPTDVNWKVGSEVICGVVSSD
jgi:hypothetical protein